jgi:catechol 2,3-dioxygenase-like lactoylglutathione lyase family enzyme
MITGLFETHIDVADLERAMRFYGEVLGLEFGLLDEERRIAFYWVGGRGEAMLGLWEKPADQIRAQHYAFRSTVDDILARSVPYLTKRGLGPRTFLNARAEQPTVFGWMPAVGMYFRDPDGHLLEFVAMLPGEARPDLGVVTWEEWQRLTG